MDVARVPGFEPGAYRLGGGCSIQLSYTRVSVQPAVSQRLIVPVPRARGQLADSHSLHEDVTVVFGSARGESRLPGTENNP